VGNERTEIDRIFDALKDRAQSIDSTLTPLVGAEGKRALNSLEKIERKLLRAEKRCIPTSSRQIEAVKDNLFLMVDFRSGREFLNFSQRDPNLYQTTFFFDPFDYRFNVLSYTT
jgi:hypothetical protein